MQKYKSYKPSGLDLFQEFPSHWKLSRMKNVGKVNQGLQIPISKRLLKKEKGSEPYITVRKINSPNSTQYYIKGANRSVRCDEEDILIARTGATGQIISNVKGVFHNNFFVFRYNQKKFSKNFILYYLSAESLRSYLLMLAGTTTIPDLNHNNFYSIPFLKLPLKEQISIANYLNSKTKLIDKKIKLLQEKIDLYKEYKKSVVNDTVLNGLKDDISHWNNKRLKDVGKLYSGLSGKSGNDFNQDENPNNKGFIPFTNIAN